MNEYNFNMQKNQEEILSEVDPNAPIVHYYKAEEDEIIKFCMANFITCFLANQCLVIETPISLWKIITHGENNEMFLYHRTISEVMIMRFQMHLFHTTMHRHVAAVPLLRIWNIS